MEIAYAMREGYLEVTVSNEYSFPLFFSMLDRIEEEGRRSCCFLILIDAMSLIGTPGDLERFELGARTAEILKPPYVILVLAEPQKINKFGETVAVNRGAVVLSTSDRDAGMRWLLDKERKLPLLSGPY